MRKTRDCQDMWRFRGLALVLAAVRVASGVEAGTTSSRREDADTRDASLHAHVMAHPTASWAERLKGYIMGWEARTFCSCRGPVTSR